MLGTEVIQSKLIISLHHYPIKANDFIAPLNVGGDSSLDCLLKRISYRKHISFSSKSTMFLRIVRDSAKHSDIKVI